MPRARIPVRRAQIGLVALIALLSLRAWAAVAIPTPNGWSRAGVDRGARDRVEQWANAAGGRVEAVLTTRSDDDYTEILALIEVGGPMPAAALAIDGDADAEAALRYDAQALFGIEGAPDSTGRIELGDPDLAILHGQWERDGETYYLALAPSGRTHAAIVMTLESRSRVLYESAFFRLLPEISGTSAALVPFRRGRWVTVALILWSVAAAGITFGVARVGLHLRPVAVAVRASAGLCAAAMLVWATSFGALASETAALSAAGVSPSWMALELSAGGFVSAALILAGASVFERGRAPVSSAPTGGVFAPRPLSSVVDALQRETPRAAPGAVPARPSAQPSAVHIDSRATPIVGIPILPPAAEEPANLVPATDPPPVPHTAEPGTPQALPLERSGRATLETEQILIDCTRPDEGAVHRRVFKDEG